MVKRIQIKVIGKVQGVFFRASTKEKADELNVKGMVRNDPDGIVFIDAEGEETDLKAFVQWCKDGPRRAIVDRIEQKESPVMGFERFEIVRR